MSTKTSLSFRSFGVGDVFYIRVKTKKQSFPWIKVMKMRRNKLVVVGEECKRYKRGHLLNFKPSNKNIALYIIT